LERLFVESLFFSQIFTFKYWVFRIS